jgi:hypothetical protein
VPHKIGANQAPEDGGCATEGPERYPVSPVQQWDCEGRDRTYREWDRAASRHARPEQVNVLALRLLDHRPILLRD